MNCCAINRVTAGDSYDPMSRRVVAPELKKNLMLLRTKYLSILREQHKCINKPDSFFLSIYPRHVPLI